MTDISLSKLTPGDDLSQCFHIRTVVFVDEQNVTVDEEMDGRDDAADHYLLSVNGKPTATARVRYPEPDLAKIERVAVVQSRRGLDIGRRLMEFIMADIMKNPAVKVMKLGAQIHVTGFYEKLGFVCYGDEFLDANIRHRWMKRNIQSLT